MPSLRDMLDAPANHPGLQTATLGFKQPLRVVQAGGPGSGRHKENDEAIKSHGWEVSKSNSAGKQYMHMSKPGMYINRDNGAWGFRIPGKMSDSTDSGKDLASLKTHLSAH